MVGISYDPLPVLRQAQEKLGLKFLLLSDPESKTINAYGILNKEARGKYEGIPHPTTFLVDSQGEIRAKLFKQGYKDRHTSDELIKASEKIQKRK